MLEKSFGVYWIYASKELFSIMVKFYQIFKKEQTYESVSNLGFEFGVGSNHLKISNTNLR